MNILIFHKNHFNLLFKKFSAYFAQISANQTQGEQEEKSRPLLNIVIYS